MSKQALEKLADQLRSLEARDLTDTEEYEKLSEEYQALAQDMLPMWQEILDMQEENTNKG